MIQRIQTLWLFLAALVLTGVFYFPIYKFSENDGLPLFAITVEENFLAIVLIGISILLSLVTIFIFKNRKKQIKYSLVNILVNVLLLAWLFYSINSNGLKMEGHTGYYWIGLFLPLIDIILIALAIKSIRSDEKLVRSSDRLRD